MNQFIKVRCDKCKNEQIIFSRSASDVNCLVCDKELAKSTGGKTKVLGKVLEVMG